MSKNRFVMMTAGLVILTVSGCSDDAAKTAGAAAGIYNGEMVEADPPQVVAVNTQALSIEQLDGIVLPNGTAAFRWVYDPGSTYLYFGNVFGDIPDVPESDATIATRINGKFDSVYEVSRNPDIAGFYGPIFGSGNATILTDPILNEDDYCFGEFADVGDDRSYFVAEVVVPDAPEEPFLDGKAFCANILESYDNGNEQYYNAAWAESTGDFDAEVSRDGLIPFDFWVGIDDTTVDINYIDEEDIWETTSYESSENSDADCYMELDFEQIDPEYNAFEASGTEFCTLEDNSETQYSFSGVAWLADDGFDMTIAGELAVPGNPLGFWMEFIQD